MSVTPQEGDLIRSVSDLITGSFSTQVAYAAVQLGLPEALANGPRAAADLANTQTAHADGMLRLLRAMTVLGFARQEADGRFSLTKAGDLLRPDSPNSLRGLAVHWGDPLWSAMGGLLHSVRTGETATHAGRSGFEALSRNPERAAILNRAMAEGSRRTGQAAVAAYDFSRFKRVMDVGGGYGAMLAEILLANPSVQGSVFELPYLERETLAYLAEAGVGGRARFFGGDFFESVPAEADCYLLKYIIHDWDDAHSIAVLTACVKAAGKEGTIMLVERIVPDHVEARPEHRAAIQGDLVMLTGAGGKERTIAEYDALFAQSGLKRSGVTPTQSAFSLIEAKAI
jgi:hypothetical protein